MDISLLLGADKNEKPLDNIVNDGGFCAIFNSLACVGDSLSSGELQSYMGGKVGYHDFYEYSWGQFLGRAAGIRTVYNFSCGGMTAKDFLTHGIYKGWFDPEKKAQGYVIALGVNDFCHYKYPVGSTDDICLEDLEKTNTDTFIGAMGKIIQMYKRNQPKAKFFLVTIPNDGRDAEILKAQREAVYALADYFDNTYVIDLYTYGPIYDQEFRNAFFLDGHMNPAGYLVTARLIGSYIDYIIRHNPDDFRQIGFVGTSYCNENYK